MQGRLSELTRESLDDEERPLQADDEQAVVTTVKRAGKEKKVGEALLLIQFDYSRHSLQPPTRPLWQVENKRH